MGLEPEPKVLPSNENAEADPMLAHAPSPSGTFVPVTVFLIRQF